MIVASKTTYEFNLNEVKKMLAKELNVATEAITVEYYMIDNSDDRYGAVPHYQVKSIKVTVNNDYEKSSVDPY